MELEKRNIAKNIINYIPSQIIPAIINLFSISLFSRLLSTAEFGYFSLVMVTIMISSSILGRWIEQGLIKHWSQFTESLNSQVNYFYNVIFILLEIIVVIFSLTVVITLYIFISRHAFYPKVLLIAFFVQTQVIFNIFLAYFQAQLNSKHYQLYNILFYLSRFLFSVIALLFVFNNFMSIIVSYFIAQLLIDMFMFKTIIKEFNFTKIFGYIDKFSWRKNKYFVTKFFLYGYPLIIYFISCQLLSFFDRYVINYYWGPTQVGIYSPNYSIASMSIGLITTPFLLAIHPVMLRFGHSPDEDISEYRFLTQKVLKAYIIFALFVLGCVVTTYKEISLLFFGKRYVEGCIIIPITSFSYLVFGFSQFAHKPFEIENKTSVIMRVILSVVGLNILLNIILVKQYGYLGSSIALLISHCLYMVLISVISVNSKYFVRLNIKDITRVIIIFLASAMICLSLNYIFDNNIVSMLLKLVLFGLLSLALLFWFGYLKEMSAILRSIWLKE